eukprot:scaffold11_cov257-Pinguiococcus_pyrenoidosus.AAC.13
MRIGIRCIGKGAKQRALCAVLDRLRRDALFPLDPSISHENPLAEMTPDELDDIKPQEAARMARAFGVQIPASATVYDASDAYLVCALAYYRQALHALGQDKALWLKYQERYAAEYADKKGVDELISSVINDVPADKDTPEEKRQERHHMQYNQVVEEWFRAAVSTIPFLQTPLFATSKAVNLRL